MKTLNNFFFGEESISFENGIWFYGFYASTGAIAAFLISQIY